MRRPGGPRAPTASLTCWSSIIVMSSGRNRSITKSGDTPCPWYGIPFGVKNRAIVSRSQAVAKSRELGLLEG